MRDTEDRPGRESAPAFSRSRRLDHVERIYFLATMSPWGNLQPIGTLAEDLGAEDRRRTGPAPGA